MLRLKNIRIDENFAEADFIPENSDKVGHIVVDLKSEEIKDIVHVEGYEFMYPGHARYRLVKMAQENDTRSETLVLWY